MAALLTSVIDNSGKVSEYILSCKNMGISILPPDINQGESGFSVSGNSIRYALTAVKGVGRPVIEQIVSERRARGAYKNLEDFISRNAENELNKRVIENLIKAGAFDNLGGTRKQFMSIYVQILDRIVSDKKHNMAGQMSLFDIVSEEQKEEFDIKLPNVGEYSKEMKLAFEKEVLGIYISGHPLEEYESLWKKNITNTTTDFLIEEESGVMRAQDGAKAVIGGLISEKKIKYTKNEQVMAFLTVEDLVGSIEVIVFPKTYSKYGSLLNEDAKVLLSGRISGEEEKDGKLICEDVTAFEDIPRELWIQFATKEEFDKSSKDMMDIMAASEGKDKVIIYIREPRLMKKLPSNQNVSADKTLLDALISRFGESNVKLM